MAAKDFEWSQLDELEQIDKDGYKWEGLKHMRKTFQPKRTKFRNKQGQPIHEKDFAKAAASYLAEEQWSKPPDNPENDSYNQTPLIEGNSTMKADNFHLNELNEIIDSQKNNKSPGPDACRSELTKWLDVTNRILLLGLINEIYTTGVYPGSLKLANIVSIYKKGDSTKMENYRPIALLQVFYKILAGLIRGRLMAAYDPWVQKTQYGFRPNKSTSQAVFIARRLMDIAERTGSKLTTIPDLEKAFDKVHQDRLLQVMRRLKVPDTMYNLIEHIYADPKFKVTTDAGQSEYRTQDSGIRQGCPLSP